MLRYLLRRLLDLIPVLLGVALLVFGFLHLTPGDPATVLLGEQATPARVAALREQLGLDRPLPVQFAAFLGRILRGELGTSIETGLPVAQGIAQRWPATFELAAAAMLVAVGLGIPAGVLAAAYQNRAWDQLTMTGSLLGVSMPAYWLGLLLVYAFAVKLNWLPPSGRLGLERAAFETPTGFYVLDALWQRDGLLLRDALAHLVLPALTLGTIPLAILARIARSATLEALNQDYIRTARAKGLRESLVLGRHALRNALLPVVTVAGLQFGTLLGGAILTETIFSWPGLGSWIYEAILARDYPVVQGGTLVVAVAFVTLNLLVDVSYALLDPRIRQR